MRITRTSHGKDWPRTQRRRGSPPPQCSEKHDLTVVHDCRQDEDIFQTARNINVAFFATIVLKDYVAAILNTPRADSTWYLDLGAEIKGLSGRVDRGTGNVVSVEFAVLYHWHAALSDADAKWMEYSFKKVFPDLKSIDDITPEQFKDFMGKLRTKFSEKPARDWEVDELKRGLDGRFKDADLAELIKNCIEEPAHAFGAHGTPASLKGVEMMAMKQARKTFNVCTINE